jgi:glycosyltransferase involved in cell wall biosynthesis
LDVLYVTYWGATDPLGQSLVLPTLRQLVAKGIGLTLVTFEKPALFARDGADVAATLARWGVRWLPLTYHKHPRVPATAYDITRGIARSTAAGAARIDVIHARTFVAGPIGLATSRILRRPWIYHNEGFYPDEQVSAGVWREGSRAHRVARSIEGTLYDRADGIIALCGRAAAEIRVRPAVARRETPVVEVPSVVDLARFGAGASVEWPPVRVMYVGSVGGRYRIDSMRRFVEALASRAPTHFRVLTQSDPALVARAFHGFATAESSWSVGSVPHDEVPAALTSQHAGLHFLSPGPGSRGGSPTKVGEYWASGMPVVTTPGVGDVDRIVAAERVGVILEDDTPVAHEKAAAELLELLRDPELRPRCRSAAERHYSLERGVDDQVRLYERLRR